MWSAPSNSLELSYHFVRQQLRSARILVLVIMLQKKHARCMQGNKHNIKIMAALLTRNDEIGIERVLSAQRCIIDAVLYRCTHVNVRGDRGPESTIAV